MGVPQAGESLQLAISPSSCQSPPVLCAHVYDWLAELKKMEIESRGADTVVPGADLEADIYQGECFNKLENDKYDIPVAPEFEGALSLEELALVAAKLEGGERHQSR